jgi:hypothetical protein
MEQTVLYVFTTRDAEYVLGRKLMPGEIDRIAGALNRELTQLAANQVLDVCSYAEPQPSTVATEVEKGYTCPRCEHLIPRDEFPGAYPGAISRFDNKTEVCSICGLDEAMGNGVVDPSLWPVVWHPKTIELDRGSAERVRERLLSGPLADQVPDAAREGGASE